MRTYFSILVALIFALIGVLLGAWWAPFLVGIALGLVIPRARVAIPFGALLGLVAWLLPLAAIQIRYGLWPTASALGAIMGFDHQGAVPIILTLLVGTLLGLAGAWLGSSARALTRAA